MTDHFRALLNRVAPHTLVSEDRQRALYWISRQAGEHLGDMAELGVYRGGTSVMIASACPHKTLHAFDTFTGIPNAAEGVDGHRVGDFSDVGGVPSILASCPNIEVHEGLFPDTAPIDPALRFCFAHFDGDTYASCVAFIDYFVPRMTPGGFLVFDDFEWPQCRGVERAVGERFEEDRIIRSAAYQCAIQC